MREGDWGGEFERQGGRVRAVKRWIIRGFFIWLLTIWIVAWAGSYWRALSVGFWHTSYEYGWAEGIGQEVVAASRGKLGVAIQRSEWKGSMDIRLKEPYRWRPAGLAGFSASARNITIPFWFPTLISVFFLWAAWRKTMPKPKGFPVELVQTAESRE